MTEKRSFPELVLPEGEWTELSRRRLQDWCRRIQNQLDLLDSDVATTEEQTAANETAIDDAVTVIETVSADLDELTTTVENLGDIIWQWNETDTSQFDSGVAFNMGAAVAGTAVLSVVTIREKPALRIASDGTTFTSGMMFHINDITTLPLRYRIEFDLVEIANVASFTPTLLVGLFSDGGASLDAALCEINGGGTSNDLRMVIADVVDVASPDLAYKTTAPTAALMNDGGFRFRFDVRRQAGGATQSWEIYAECGGGAATSSPRARFRSSSTSTPALPSLAGWNSLDMNRVGIGLAETSGVNSRYFSIKNFRIRDLT